MPTRSPLRIPWLPRDLARRRREPEWMDDPGLSPALHADALRGLARLNDLARSTALLRATIYRLAPGQSRIRVLDLGCGDGALLGDLHRSSRGRISGTGLDISPVAHARALQFSAEELDFQQADLLADRWPVAPRTHDVVLLSLFLHHFDEPDAVRLLRRAAHHARHVLVPNSLFTDGAAACSVSTDAQFEDAPEIVKVVPVDLGAETRQLMSWRITNHGFAMTLDARVPDGLSDKAPAIIDDWLSSCSMNKKEIETWAIHPGGPRVLQMMARTLALSEEVISPSVRILNEYGNMSSATLPFIWERMKITKTSSPTLSIAFGPGLVAELMLLK